MRSEEIDKLSAEQSRCPDIVQQGWFYKRLHADVDIRCRHTTGSWTKTIVICPISTV